MQIGIMMFTKRRHPMNSAPSIVFCPSTHKKSHMLPLFNTAYAKQCGCDPAIAMSERLAYSADHTCMMQNAISKCTMGADDLVDLTLSIYDEMDRLSARAELLLM
jgi:hypothetical protein